MSQQYILYEHAAGYALLTAEPDEFLAQAGDIVSDITKFRQICDFFAFQPFKRGREALENLNSISEGVVHPDLELFLKTSLPKKNYVLGVIDSQLATFFKDNHGIICNSTDAVKELIRGIRLHFQDLIPAFGDLNASNKVQLGLAHAYSRSKVKFNVSRVDNMIIQTINLVDQLDKDINSLSMRVREWYSHHFPELVKIVPENALYIQCIDAVRDRKNMPDDVAEKLENVLNDPNKVQNIIELARSSMGMDITGTDLENMYYFVKRVIALSQRRKDLTDYLQSKMDCVAPNLAALTGNFVGARLIAQAGSLTNLAKAPASTVQILGAEKALFRALKTRGNTPKYGLLFHSKFIGKAAKQNKGRISRYLANKCSVASRLDCFLDVPTNIFGNKLREQVEDRLKYYETGDEPKKNTDIMDKALEELEATQREIVKKEKIEGKQAKKRKLEELYLPTELDQTMASLAESTVAGEVDTSIVKKKKKKKKHNDTLELNDQSMEALDESAVTDEVDTSIVKRKKKKRKLNDSYYLNNETSTELTEDVAENEVDTSLVRKKHNDTHELNGQSMEALDESTVADEADTSVVKKKKKKKKKHNDSHDLNNETTTEFTEDVAENEVDTSLLRKKKKKHNDTYELTDQSMEALDESTVADEADTSVLKKKKKKKKKRNDAEQEM